MADIYLKTSSPKATMGLFNKHLTKVAERSLIAHPVLYEFADKHPLPGKSGKTLFVPRHISVDSTKVLTEGTIVSVCANSAGYYSATVAGYGAARGYTDFLEMVREIPTTITHDIEDMMKDSARKVDSLLRLSLCAAGTFVSPDGSTAAASVKSSTNLKQRFLFDASTTLASNLAPTYGDGFYWGAFHPRAIHDLFVNTSSGGTVLGAGYMELTDVGATKLERATIGALGGVRIFKTTNAPKILALGGMSATTSGHGSYVMGPGAIGAIDLSTARLKTYIKELGSAGWADPIDQKMTVGVKFYFASLAKDVTNRLVRTASGVTL